MNLLNLPLAMVLVSTTGAAAPEMPLTISEVTTYEADGRLPLAQLLGHYRPLLEAGWICELIAQSRPEGTGSALPIFAIRTPRDGPAAWFVSGIHGEEPAGPNALAAEVGTLLELGSRVPVVIVPLANPHGYVRNWRYLNTPEWSENADLHSVGDSSHLLPDSRQAETAREASASSPEADALTAYLLSRALSHPPRWWIDLHEDDDLDAGYVYSQGAEGANDRLAALAVQVLREQSVAVQMEGFTAFGELIAGGIIGPVEDSSIDELASAREILVQGRAAPGPFAHTVLVFETPSAALPLAQRVAAHAALVRRLAREIRPD